MGQVGILEQLYHSHIAYQTAQAAEAAGHDVTFYVSGGVRDRLDEFDPLEAGIVQRGEEEALSAYLSRIDTRHLDLLLVNTVAHTKAHDHPAEPYRSFAEFRPACPVVYTIYGVHTWLGDQAVTGDDATRNTYRRKLAQQADGLVVQYSPWKAFADRLNPPAPIMEYPYPIYEPGDAVRDDKYVDVVLPGALHRRNFEPVANALGPAWDDGLPLRLTVASRVRESYDEEVMDMLENAKSLGRPIRTITEFLPRAEYDAMLREADIILAPLRETVPQRGFTEQMGHTTGSGVIFDAIRVGRPLILPAFFPLGWELEDHGVLTYDSAEALLGQLTRFATEDDLRASLEREARQNASAFVLEQQAGRFNGLLRQLERVDPVLDHD